jgi:hypothetical protein
MTAVTAILAVLQRDITAPTVPTSVFASPFSSESRIHVSWAASTDNVGVASYTIYKCTGASCTPVAYTTSTTNSFDDFGGFSVGQTYRYQVLAVDFAGNQSAPSTIAQTSYF